MVELVFEMRPSKLFSYPEETELKVQSLFHTGICSSFLKPRQLQPGQPDPVSKLMPKLQLSKGFLVVNLRKKCVSLLRSASMATK